MDKGLLILIALIAFVMWIEDGKKGMKHFLKFLGWIAFAVLVLSAFGYVEFTQTHILFKPIR